MGQIRHDWTRDEIEAIYRRPIIELIYDAQTAHRQFFKPGEVQKSTLLSIKTGACPEDCSYCPQSARYNTELEREPLLPLEEVLTEAQNAKASGSTRFCMGAAWREVKEGPDFERVLEMVRGVSKLGMEVCCTLGMLTTEQATKLREAGLTAYNHNLDTSPEFYDQIITTRCYEDRLKTLENVRAAGIQVCCGGIIGMGESREDRIGLLHELASQDPHPESVPINRLVPVAGTPLGDAQRASEQREREGEARQGLLAEGATQAPMTVEWIRCIATARIIMPASMVRLSAGRTELSDTDQALAFMAGANSIFAGEKLLTTPNPEIDADQALFKQLGLTEMQIS